MRVVKRTILPVITMYLFGFGWFLGQIPEPSFPNMVPKNLDVVVALTGGTNRVSTSLDLYANGAAPVLFVSGVGKNVSRQDILAQHGVELTEEQQHGIVLGRLAQDTIGNAKEVVMHARDQGWDRMLIVTANYHVPRSKLLFSKRLPGHPLYFYAIDPIDDVSWRLRFMEYNKWLMAYIL